jgi:hypothetical protein
MIKGDIMNDELIEAFVEFEEKINKRTSFIQSFVNYPTNTKGWIRDIRLDWENQLLYSTNEYDFRELGDRLMFYRAKCKLEMFKKFCEENPAFLAELQKNNDSVG